MCSRLVSVRVSREYSKMGHARIVEGYLTAERMSQFYSNFYPLLQPNEVRRQRGCLPKWYFGLLQDSTLAMMNIRLTLTMAFLADIC